MHTYTLDLEHGPRQQKTMVHVTSLLGCTAKAPTTDAALAATPGAIRGYLRFLRQHGEPVDPDAEFDTRIAERVTEGYFLGNGSAGIIFQSDRQLLTVVDVETYVRWLGWMRGEIVERA